MARLKRTVSVLLCIGILMSLFCVSPSAAMQNWEYKFDLQISGASNSKSKGPIDGNLYFNGTKDKETFQIPNTKKTGAFTEATFKTSRAPWTLDYAEVSNSTRDALKILYISLWVRLEGESQWQMILAPTYPSGRGNKDGKWIETQRGSKHDKTFRATVWPEREITAAGNLNEPSSNLGGTVYVDTAWADGKSDVVTCRYDGTVVDTKYKVLFGKERYYCMNMSDAPNVSISADGVKGGRYERISFATLKDSKGAGFEEINENDRLMGFKYDKKKLAAFMNQYNVNHLTVTTEVSFPAESTDYRKYQTKYTQTRTFIRKAFAVGTPVLSGAKGQPYAAGRDNNYYNIEGIPGGIQIKLPIKNDTTYNKHLSGDNLFSGATLSFSKATLALGNTNKTIELGKTTLNLSDNSFTLHFPYQKDMTSGNDNMKLSIEGATLKLKGSSEIYVLWDEYDNKSTYSQLLSGYKLDAAAPNVELTAGDSKPLQKTWRQFMYLNSRPNKTLISGNMNGQYTMEVLRETESGLQPVQIHNRYGGISASRNVPAAAGSSFPTEISLYDRVEGSFTLRLTGKDAAGNVLEQLVPDIYLDNKAPEASVEEVRDTKPAGDGTLSHTYKIGLSDASGTGRLYYCFTDKTYGAAPSFDESTAQGQTSGVIDSTLNRWAFIDQSEVSGNKTAAAVLKVNKGERFRGRLFFFAKDSFGNRTATEVRDLDIMNETTECLIAAKEDSATPHPSYNIDITTPSVNAVLYRWVDSRGNYLNEYKLYRPGDVIGQGEQPFWGGQTMTMNGTYTLDCLVTTPSGTNKTYKKDFVFDNAEPELNVSVKAPNTYRKSQTVTVKGTDASGISEAWAQVVRPDGTAIDGQSEFPLTITGGVISQDITFSDLPSGAYALRVRAIDAGGREGVLDASSYAAYQQEMPRFYIRSGAPSVTAELKTKATYTDMPLLPSTDYDVNLSVSEAFTSAEKAGTQKLYWRISDDMQSYTAWTELDTVKAQGDTLQLDTVLHAPMTALMAGENTLYLQTTVAPPSTNLTDVDPDLIHTAVLTCYLDEVAPPIYNVDYEDVHTTENAAATVQVRDNIDAPVTLTCADSRVTVTATDSADTFTVTATEKVDTELLATDLAGHVTKIPFVVTGIDREAPIARVTEHKTTNSGDRQDAVATVMIDEAKRGTVEFALIPAAEADAAITDGKLNEKYFDYNRDTAKIVLQSASDAKWTEEENLTYTVTLAGVTGEYRIGLRMADSLGNKTDVILPEVLSAADAQIEMGNHDVLPKQTGDRAKATAHFNVPVYVLPQDKITASADTADDLTVEETNLELAKQNASGFAQDYSFMVTENKDYTLYTVDDLGRTKVVTFTVEGIEFGVLKGVNIKTLVDGEELAPGKLAPVGSWEHETKLVITPEAEGQLIRDVHGEDSDWQRENGIWLAQEECEQDSNDGRGYTKLVYTVSQKGYSDEYGIWYISPTADRFMEFYVFTPGAGEDTWGMSIASVNTLDNTDPDIDMTVTPKLQKDEPMLDPAPGASMSPNSDFYFTRGNVTVTLAMEDPDSGLRDVRLSRFAKLNGSGMEAMWQEGEMLMGDDESIIIPLVNADGSGIDYTKTPWKQTLTDSEGNPVVTFTLNGTDDPKGVKTMVAVFEQNAIGDVDVYNNAGMVVSPEAPCRRLERFGTINISRLPAIAEGVDYYIDYMYEAPEGYWSSLSPEDEVYYQKAVATLRLTDKGVERGLSVVNNGRSLTKELNSYVPGFTFKLRDQYGATAEADVLLGGFDDRPGTISYELSTTAKTKDPVTVTITAADAESGVASVTLSDKAGNPITLTEKSVTATESVYEGQLTAIGAYCITMVDKAGNKTTKNVSVTNIDNVVPTATVTYSIDQESSKSSKNVSAQLTYSKPDVRITSVEPDDSTKETTYTVNYGSSTLYFTENGTVTVFFTDAYGNEGSEVVTVKSIYRQTPALTAKTAISADKMSVTVTFDKALDEQTGVPIDTQRELTDLTVMYGGRARRVQEVDEKGNTIEASYTFGENGAYTFKVYDDNGSTSYLTVEITGIDKKAPEIRQIRWHYEYDVKVGDTWTTQVADGSRDVGSEAGYIMAGDIYKPTNRDVTLTVVTDDDTRPVGSSEGYTKENQKVYTDNGMYIFNLEKENRLSDSYAVDIELIDKTPPVLTLSAPELVFYENQEVGEPYSKALLDGPGTAFSAYDMFGGKKKDLTNDVQITYDQRFNPDDILANVFDRSISYLIKYSVSDEAHNITEATRSVRLVGMYDTIALVDGKLPDAAGRCEAEGGTFTIELMNFSGTAYAKYASGLNTMGQMKAGGDILSRGEDGKFTLSGAKEGWYTVLVQTDKRDYILLQIYVYE